MACQSPYSGPETENFDRSVFKNGTPQRRSTLDFLRYTLGGPDTPWPESIPVVVKNIAEEHVQEGIRYAFISHSTLSHSDFRT